MTDRHESKRIAEEKILLFKKVCRENGMKGTPQRLEIFLEIMGAADHPAAERALPGTRTVRLPTVSLDTVYRNPGNPRTMQPDIEGQVALGSRTLRSQHLSPSSRGVSGMRCRQGFLFGKSSTQPRSRRK